MNSNILSRDQVATETEGLSVPLISLLKGIVCRQDNESLWQCVLNLRTVLTDYVAVLGLDLLVDEAEGFAWLRSRELDDGETALPRLLTRRQLPYLSSLLLALLCRKLAETDAGGNAGKLVLDRSELVELVRVFLPQRGNEARLSDQVMTALGRIEDLGFVRRIKDDEGRYEIRRIIRAFVDAQWLAEFSGRLEEYRQFGEAGKESEQ